MIRSRVVRASLVLVAGSVALGGCDGDSAGPLTPAAVALVSGDEQTGAAAQALTQPLVVKVTSSAGRGVSAVTVHWAITSGGGSLSADSVGTDAQGQASVTWTLGPSAGIQTASATASRLTGSPVSFSATSTPNATISGVIAVTSKLLSVGVSPAKAQAGGMRLPSPPRSKSASFKSAFPGLSLARQQARPAAEFTADELILSFRAGAIGAPRIGSAALASPVTARGVGQAIRSRLVPYEAQSRLDIVGVSPAILAARVRVREPAGLDAVAAELRGDPAIAVVERNPIVRLQGGRSSFASAVATTPNDPLYPAQAWHYFMIDLPEAWDLTTGSPAVLVGVVDDGIRFDHPAIAANLTSDGFDFVSDFQVPLCAGGTISKAGDGDGYDSDPTQPAVYEIDPTMDCAVPGTLGNHGLHVAGTIGAVGNDGTGVTGVNWTVRIRPVRTIGVTGTGTVYDLAQGILYAAGLPADNGAGGTVQASTGARIVNVSAGGPQPSLTLENAVTAATSEGALIVAAAGNEANSDPFYPAAYPEVLSVSAVGPDRELASYSSFGPTVDLAAPGGDFSDGDATFGVASSAWDYSTSSPAYAFGSGTSFAAPHVSGVTALLLAREPALTAAQLRSRLTTYAVDAGPPGVDDFYSAGIVNARNTLTQSLAPPRRLYARIFDASSGAQVQTVLAGTDGSYAFGAVPDGVYHVFAGEDENLDQGIGIPGRRWGAFGGTVTPIAITVSGAGTYPASFTIGLPAEAEPNDTPADADALRVGGYVLGSIDRASDVDVSVIRIHGAALYTFETSGWDGACGFALEEDTILGLFDSSGNLVAFNDDIDLSAGNYCSRVTQGLTPGTYYIQVVGYIQSPGMRYRVQARSGS